MLVFKICNYNSGYKLINKIPGLLFKSNNKFNVFSSCAHQISTDSQFTELSKSSDSFPEIPEHPSLEQLELIINPSFSSLGLNNFTPTGLVQFILENVHNSLSLPWWACIAITALLIRSAIVPVSINQRRTTINMQNSYGKLTRLTIEAVEARESGNSFLMLQKLKEIDKVNMESNFNIIKIFQPILIQAPVFISVFTALRGMSNAGIPSLANGGLWWFPDLTVSDPYFILPALAAGFLSLMMECNITSSTSASSSIKWVFRALGPVSFLFFCQMPSTLVLYWSISNLYSLAFVLLLMNSKMRQILKIPEVLSPPIIDNPKNYGLKDTMKLLTAQNEIVIRERTVDNRFSKEEQAYVLDRGLKAAEIRKSMKKIEKQ